MEKFAHIIDYCQTCHPDKNLQAQYDAGWLSLEGWLHGIPVAIIESGPGWARFLHRCPRGHTWGCSWAGDSLDGTSLAKQSRLKSRQVKPLVISSRRGVIYVAQCGDFCKIGYTSGSAGARVKSLQTGNPQEIVLLGAVQGPPAKEAELHLRFQDKRVRGEWFNLTQEDVQDILASGA